MSRTVIQVEGHERACSKPALKSSTMLQNAAAFQPLESKIRDVV